MQGKKHLPCFALALLLATVLLAGCGINSATSAQSSPTATAPTQVISLRDRNTNSPSSGRLADIYGCSLWLSLRSAWHPPSLIPSRRPLYLLAIGSQ